MPGQWWDTLLSVVKNPYVTNLVSAWLGFFSYRIYRYARSSRGQLSGTWYGEVFDESGQIVKYDLYRVKHSRENLFVTGRRLYPESQQHRTWDFQGVYRDRTVSGHYKSIDPRVKSLGAVLLIADDRGELLRGFFMTISSGSTEPGKLRVLLQKV